MSLKVELELASAADWETLAYECYAMLEKNEDYKGNLNISFYVRGKKMFQKEGMVDSYLWKENPFAPRGVRSEPISLLDNTKHVSDDCQNRMNKTNGVKCLRLEFPYKYEDDVEVNCTVIDGNITKSSVMQSPGGLTTSFITISFTHRPPFPLKSKCIYLPMYIT